MDDEDFLLSETLQESDNLMEFEDETSNLRNEAYAGKSLVNEVSEVDMNVEDETLCRQPSTSGSYDRKRKSHSSFPHANKVSRNSWNVDHQQQEENSDHESKSHERILDALSFQNVASVGRIESHAEFSAIQYPKNFDKIGILLFNDNINSEVNISSGCGFVYDKLSKELYTDFVEAIPKKPKQPFEKEESSFGVIDYSQNDMCKKFGIYKCDCGLMFSSKHNFQLHRRLLR